MKVFGQDHFKLSPRSQHIETKNWTWKPAHMDWIKKPKQFYIKNKFEVFSLDKTKKFILIIAQNDVQTGALIKKLKELKKPFVFINWDQFMLSGQIYYNLNSGKHIISLGDWSIDLKNAKSIYYSTPDVVESQWDTSSYFNFSEKLFINRWAEALLNLEGSLGQTKWFPAAPSQLYSLSQKKWSELVFAKRLGFRVPNTIFTTSPEAAHEFLHKYPKVILREYGRRAFLDKQNNFKNLKTPVIDPHDKNLGDILSAPCVFQEYISKKYDIRSIVVGKKVLSCKIESQTHGLASGDWRGHENKTPFRKYRLPRNIEKKLLQFAKAKNFRFASFDLIRAEDGSYYFLEMNRPGNWFFIEALSGAEIRKQLIKSF